jgi:hypothetical protein
VQFSGIFVDAAGAFFDVAAAAFESSDDERAGDMIGIDVKAMAWEVSVPMTPRRRSCAESPATVRIARLRSFMGR